MSPNQLQNKPGVIKPTQQRYGTGHIARHIHFDRPTESTLQQALQVLSGEDRISIGLVVRRALRVYAESLLRSEAYLEAERKKVREGAWIAPRSRHHAK